MVRLTTTYLHERGSESARLDAELLVAHALGLRRIDLYLQFDRSLEEAQLAAIREVVRQRGSGRPIAYITGTREFFSRSFAVTPDVLVPRPETETLVQAVLACVRDEPGSTIADLGTGSGCIAITLAAELPGAHVIAADISDAALEVARQNAARHGVDERVQFVCGQWADALDRRVDVVVSNPPYVTASELATAPRDVRDFEPHLALHGGVEGLDAYRSLIASLPSKLQPRAHIALEADPRRTAAVRGLLASTFPRARTEIVDDLSRTPRVVLAHLGVS